MNEIRVLADADAIARAAADYIRDLAAQSIQAHDRFSLALSGGSTPRKLYQLLAQQTGIDWRHVHIFWGDERCVASDHVDSNYRMAKESLLDHVPIPGEQIHRMKGELDPAHAAAEYEHILRDHFGQSQPRFDLVLLGMGDDGHTASLFPHTAALSETQRWVVGNFAEAKQTWRITLTAIAINAAQNVMFLVSGIDKAERLRQVLKGPYSPDELPSQLIKPVDGKLIWMVDSPAASLL